MPNKTINIAELIADKIKVRYAEITERTMGSANMVIDAFYPTYVRESLVSGAQERNLSKKCSAISPFIANELNVYQIPIEDLVGMLGYKKLNIKKILEAVKEKDIELVLAGLGGTGMNFMHWATELCNYTNTVNIFKEITIYDADKVDITNIFRFPQHLNPSNAYSHTLSNNFKVDMISNNSILSSKKISKIYHFIRKDTLYYYTEFGKNENGEIIKLDNPLQDIMPGIKNKVFYGAPTIETREIFSEHPDLKFVSGTHGNNDCQLYIKPEQDSSIQIESYGMINLSVFFMNQLKLTISFLELLSSDTDLSVSNLVMEYSFAAEYANGRINKAGMNRTYNFPILANNFIDQEANLQMEYEINNEQETEIHVDNIEPQNENIIPYVPQAREDMEQSEYARITSFYQELAPRYSNDTLQASAERRASFLSDNYTTYGFIDTPIAEESQEEGEFNERAVEVATAQTPARRRRRTRAQIDADNEAAEQARAEAEEISI